MREFTDTCDTNNRFWVGDAFARYNLSYFLMSHGDVHSVMVFHSVFEEIFKVNESFFCAVVGKICQILYFYWTNKCFESHLSSQVKLPKDVDKMEEKKKMCFVICKKKKKL